MSNENTTQWIQKATEQHNPRLTLSLAMSVVLPIFKDVTTYHIVDKNKAQENRN